MSELPEQTGLAYAWLSDEGHYLAAAAAGSLQRLAERLELSAAPHKASEPARGRGLQSRAYRTGTNDLIHFNWFTQTFHINGTDRLYLHVAFR